MKKLSLMLAFVLVFALVLVACGDETETSSTPATESSVAADASSEAATEESSEAAVEESSEAAVEESSEAAVEESSEAAVEESSEAVVEDTSVEIVEGNGANVALNKSYTISGIGNRDAYYGNITDGVVAVGLGEDKESVWFGFYENGANPTNAPDKIGYFIIDLENAYSLTSVKAHLINKDAWGIGVPVSAKAYISIDGTNFTEAGELEIDSTDGVEYWTEVEVTGNARYVKFELTLSTSFAFVSEVEVYAE